jgi:hypothetical protein
MITVTEIPECACSLCSLPGTRAPNPGWDAIFCTWITLDQGGRSRLAPYTLKAIKSNILVSHRPVDAIARLHHTRGHSNERCREWSIRNFCRS